MCRISFEQHWHQQDLITEQEDLEGQEILVENIFLGRDEIKWLMDRGYQPSKSRYVYPGNISAAWSWSFDIDEDVKLLLMLAYPQERYRINIIDEEIIERHIHE
jgi:hypothetical protein